jgi:hypothetical protein
MENATVHSASASQGLVEVDAEIVARIAEVVIAQITPGLKELNDGLAKFASDARWRIEERLDRAEKIMLKTVTALGEEVTRLETVVEPPGATQPTSELALSVLSEELTLEGKLRPIVGSQRNTSPWALIVAAFVGAGAALAGSYVASREAENRAMREALAW